MLLIDAYNVLLMEGVLPPHLAGLDLTGLAALLAISRYARRQTVLVCDGREKDPRGQLGARTTVRYSGPDRTADDVILSTIHSHSAPRTILLVTTDRALAAAARRRRTDTMRSEDFLTHLARDEARGGRTRRPRPMPPVPLDRGVVARWMREFGYACADEAGAPGDRMAPKGPESRGKPAESGDAGRPPRAEVPAPIDPLLLAAVEAWAGRLQLSDLDMERWLRGAKPRR
ncbi:MAG: NYN domain-containing protein [Phycisphaerales bacterium]|nr:NYN domain-containing protein [Phycisphaerales bacterium]